MSVVICGFTGVGKRTAAGYFFSKGYTHVVFGDVVTKYEHHSPKQNTDMSQFSIHMYRDGRKYLSDTSNCMIPDGNYSDECEKIKNNGGTTVFLKRPGHIEIPEEWQIITMLNPDYIIDNNDSKEALFKKLDKIVNRNKIYFTGSLCFTKEISRIKKFLKMSGCKPVFNWEKYPIKKNDDVCTSNTIIAIFTSEFAEYEEAFDDIKRALGFGKMVIILDLCNIGGAKFRKNSFYHHPDVILTSSCEELVEIF